MDINDSYDQNRVIEVKNITQEFTVADKPFTALQQASFNIKANSFNIIFGQSGSGKSTLLNVLAGLQKPTSGEVLVMGQDIYSLSPDELAHYRANKVGFMHQTNHWVKSLNVIENLSVPLYFLGYSKIRAKQIAEIALDRVNMRDYADKNPSNLSGGEQQRLAMARALANDPLFIIADEPTGNLDSKNATMLMDLLANAQSEFRRTIILVTHNLEYVSLADHLLNIRDGVVEDIKSTNLESVTNDLINDMKQRINKISRSKKKK